MDVNPDTIQEAVVVPAPAVDAVPAVDSASGVSSTPAETAPAAADVVDPKAVDLTAGVADGTVVKNEAEKLFEKIVHEIDELGEVVGWHKEAVEDKDEAK
jgi:hypothetical protein